MVFAISVLCFGCRSARRRYSASLVMFLSVVEVGICSMGARGCSVVAYMALMDARNRRISDSNCDLTSAQMYA